MVRNAYAPKRQMFRSVMLDACAWVRRVRQRVGEMNLAYRRHRRKRDRDTERGDEGNKSQTWGHLKSSFWNQTNATAIVPTDYKLVAPRP